MREIQHEQAVAALRRDLNALRANPKLEDKVIELEERHQEMEELLRSKCQEIEENDDRVLEYVLLYQAAHCYVDEQYVGCSKRKRSSRARLSRYPEKCIRCKPS